MAKQRIAIVGAGPAGLSTAAHLTDPGLNPGWEDRYEIDVYQMGWRVGGKGATGRNPDANDRLQEHGIHVFGNMYFNSFAMVRSAYEHVEWDEHDKYRTIESAFRPSTFTYNLDYWNQRWHEAAGKFPFNDAVPWDNRMPDEREIAQEVISMVDASLAAAVDARAAKHSGFVGKLVIEVERLIGRGAEKVMIALAKRMREEQSRPHPPHHQHHGLVLKVLDAAVALLGKLVDADPEDAALRINYTMADLAVTVLRGIIDDDVLAEGLDSIDHENYDVWLRRHGASERTMNSSTPQIFPNTALGYLHGDTTAVPTMSAAAYATFFLRQVTGSGAGAYFFAEGTGETIMKPLYRVLEQRGVRFHFFHKLTEVVAPADSTEIAALRFDVQATVVGGGAYDPLRRLDDGELVWPDRPNFAQLDQGKELQESGADLESWWTPWKPVATAELRAGEHYDQVVLATPVATLPHVAGDLIHHPRVGASWTDMIDNSTTAASQAVQIWLSKTTRELGWDLTSGARVPSGEHAALPHLRDRYVGCLYQQDLTSFCDFSDLVAEERWPADNTPKGLIYFIGALADPEVIPDFDDHEYPARELARAQWSSVQYFRTISALLPKAVAADDPRSLDFDLLSPTDPTNRRTGIYQFFDQFVKVNIDPNERYTLSRPGTVRKRFNAWDGGFTNLVLAGDWTYTGFNVGSFEGAVMSGMLASHAICGFPALEDIVGYDHP